MPLLENPITTTEQLERIVQIARTEERKRISRTTKEGLQEAKRRGVKLGRPRTLPATSERRVLDLHAAGLTLSAISDRLNAEGTPTGRGGKWHPSTVSRIIHRNGS